MALSGSSAIKANDVQKNKKIKPNLKELKIKRSQFINISYEILYYKGIEINLFCLRQPIRRSGRR
jgi:hypothetical protein